MNLSHCSGFDAVEIARVLDLELSSTEQGPTPVQLPPVSLTCDADRISVAVEDVVTGKLLTRGVPAPSPEDPMRNRVVALAVAELFMSSWLELLVPPEQRVVKRSPPPPPTSAPPPEKPPPRKPRTLREVLASATLRSRILDAPNLGYGPSLTAAWTWNDRYRYSLTAELEEARASRLGGNVVSRVVMLGAGSGLRLRQTHSLFWDLDFVASLAIVHANGRSASSAWIEHSATAMGADVAIHAGPALRFAPLVTKLNVMSGFTFPKFTARVDGDKSVEFSGFWLGVALAFGFAEAES